MALLPPALKSRFSTEPPRRAKMGFMRGPPRTVPPPPFAGQPSPWVGKGKERVHRLMTRERFPYLHDLLASTANQDEIEIWESLDSRLSHWQGRNWRQDTKMIWALGSEAEVDRLAN